MRWPSGPGHGIESRPGSSFWNFTHMTLRPLVLVDAPGAGEAEGPQESAMDKIVMHIDREREARVRGPQRLLDERGAGRAREDEPEIARAFRQRHQQLIRLRGDLDVFDAGDGARL